MEPQSAARELVPGVAFGGVPVGHLPPPGSWEEKNGAINSSLLPIKHQVSTIRGEPLVPIRENPAGSMKKPGGEQRGAFAKNSRTSQYLKTLPGPIGISPN